MFLDGAFYDILSVEPYSQFKLVPKVMVPAKFLLITP